MLLKVEMPLIDPSLRGGHMVRWVKREGETFGFGEELCVVAVDEFAAVRRTGRATKLSNRRRRKALRSEVEVREGKVYLEVGLTSSDAGVVRRIVVDDGGAVGVGDLLAVVSTAAGDEVAGTVDEWRDAPELRVVANAVHRDEGDHDLEEVD